MAAPIPEFTEAKGETDGYSSRVEFYGLIDWT